MVETLQMEKGLLSDPTILPVVPRCYPGHIHQLQHESVAQIWVTSFFQGGLSERIQDIYMSLAS